MIRFLKENWIWIVLPFVLVIGGLLAVFLMSGGDDGVSEFIYTL